VTIPEVEQRAAEDATEIPDLAAESPHVQRLAELVSIAVRVEPALLRAVRLRLCPRLPAAAEADLWFSGLIDARNRAGFTLLPWVRAALQQRLAGRPNDLAAAWRVVEAIHAGAPQLMRIEERLVWLALSGAPDEVLAGELDAIVAAMTGERDRGRGLSQWALRAVPRLPPRLHRLDQVWMLAVGGSARLGGRRILAGRPPADALRTWLPRVVPEDVARIAVGARLRAGGIELSEPPADPVSVFEAPATDPVIVEVLPRDSARPGRQVALNRGTTVTVEIPFDDVYLRTVVGEIFEVVAGAPDGDSHRVRRGLDFRDERLPLLPYPPGITAAARHTDPRLLKVAAPIRVVRPVADEDRREVFGPRPPR
jgi:hypothetical protein